MSVTSSTIFEAGVNLSVTGMKGWGTGTGIKKMYYDASLGKSSYTKVRLFKSTRGRN